MKKIISVLLAILLLASLTSCGAKDESDETTTELTTAVITTEQTTEAVQSTTQASTPQTTKAKPQQSAQTTVAQTTSAEVTYYSDNPDNKYICAVADKFGSDKSNMIALIRKNTSTDGATVLEFSGSRDQSGKLITTIDELKYIYDVFDNGTIRRASRNSSENISYTSITSKVAFALAEQYMLPNLDKMRETRRYEDFF